MIAMSLISLIFVKYFYNMSTEKKQDVVFDEIKIEPKATHSLRTLVYDFLDSDSVSSLLTFRRGFLTFHSIGRILEIVKDIIDLYNDEPLANWFQFFLNESDLDCCGTEYDLEQRPSVDVLNLSDDAATIVSNKLEKMEAALNAFDNCLFDIL